MKKFGATLAIILCVRGALICTPAGSNFETPPRRFSSATSRPRSENEDIDKAISRLTKEMKEAAKNLDFERAAEIRDKVRELKEVRIFV